MINQDDDRPARRRQFLTHFGDMLNAIFTPQPSLNTIAAGDAPICRCEEVSVGAVRAALIRGSVEPDTLEAGIWVGKARVRGEPTARYWPGL